MRIFCIAALACSYILSGCGEQEPTVQEDKVEEKKEETKEEEKLKTIGMEAEGENIYKVILENNTGKEIIGVAIKDSSMDAYPENMLAENDKYIKEEKRIVFYDATAAKEAAENQQIDSESPILDPQFDIQLTFDDQTVLVLNAFPFDDMEEGKICLEDGVAFIEYQSVADKQKVSTKEAELNRKAEAEAAAAAKAQAEAEAAAKAQAEAQAQAEAEAAAQAQAEAEAAAAQRQQQSSPASSNSDNNSQGCVGNDADFW